MLDFGNRRYLDRWPVRPDVAFCTTEPGEIKTIDIPGIGPGKAIVINMTTTVLLLGPGLK